MFKRSLTRTLVLITPLITLTACSDSPEIKKPMDSDKIHVLEVTKTTYQKQPAIRIAFGEDKDDACFVTFLESAIHDGFEFSGVHTYQTPVSNMCMIDGDYSSTSSKFDTNISVHITDYDSQTETLSFDITLKTVSVNGDGNQFFYYSIPKTHLTAQSPLFAISTQTSSSTKPSIPIPTIETAQQEIPFSERPLIGEEERDQLIVDMTNFYLESIADLLSHYSAYKNQERSVFILWHNKEWLPPVNTQEEHFNSIISTYQIGVTNQDFFAIRGAISNLSHISLLLMQSIRDNNPDALETARMHLRNGMTGVGKTVESLKLQQRIIIPDAIRQQANN